MVVFFLSVEWPFTCLDEVVYPSELELEYETPRGFFVFFLNIVNVGRIRENTLSDIFPNTYC